MTTEHTILAALSTLLIAGLLIYLRGKFRYMSMTPEEKMADLEAACQELIYRRSKLAESRQPKCSCGYEFNEHGMTILFSPVVALYASAVKTEKRE